LAEFCPNARIVLAIRNPIERAFSHFWHEKKKRTINWGFSDVLGNNVDIFDSWIATGFYSHHIQELLKLFHYDNIKVAVYDDLVLDARGYVRDIFDFLGVDSSFEPSILDTRVNKASYTPTTLEKLVNLLKGRPKGESEYERGILEGIHEQLVLVFEPEIQKLNHLLDRNFDHWLQR
jgi:hypothetical protein